MQNFAVSARHSEWNHRARRVLGLSQSVALANDTKATGTLVDADDTAKALLTLNLLGVPSDLNRLIAEFESATHFRTFKQESSASLSTNCNVLDALLHSPSPEQHIETISKVAEYLCDAWYSGQIKDKWVGFE